jgi:NAD(P)-dependent dehydrogenase (short-subunit alcohol dehydrogenase family)
MARLAGKIAMVTGAASGIGAATAALFAAEGAQVVAADIVPVDEAGGAARNVLLDVRSDEDWRTAIGEATDAFGCLDILVNCAGVNADPRAPDVDQTPDVLALDKVRGVMGINLEGTILGCRHAVTAMREGGGGAIVNVSSIAAIRGWPVRTAYAISKAGVLQYTMSLAVRCARAGWKIRCNAVLPGPIATPMLVAISGTRRKAGDGRPGTDHVPLGRLGEPVEVAAPILFLASDDASYITGTGLVIDGGITAV